MKAATRRLFNYQSGTVAALSRWRWFWIPSLYALALLFVSSLPRTASDRRTIDVPAVLTLILLAQPVMFNAGAPRVSSQINPGHQRGGSDLSRKTQLQSARTNKGVVGFVS